MHLPLGWHTDLGVLRLGGAEVTDHGDHLVVVSADNPLYHWGNLVLVTDPATVSDAPRWLRRFEELFPTAEHRSIGLVAEPDGAAWTDLGLEVEVDDVLVSGGPEIRSCPVGYDVRPLGSDADWEQSRRMRVGAYGDEEFEHGRTRTRIAMTATGATAWFGAFDADDVLAAELGIVDLGDGTARYQTVMTREQHRRRGLTGHLLGVAATWAGERGAQQLVIVADVDSDGGRLYRSAGFEVGESSWQAARTPPKEPAVS